MSDIVYLLSVTSSIGGSVEKGCEAGLNTPLTLWRFVLHCSEESTACPNHGLIEVTRPNPKPPESVLAKDFATLVAFFSSIAGLFALAQ